MKRAADLSREELVGIVDSMQAWLWLDSDNRGDFWNPEKVQDQDAYDYMVGVLDVVGVNKGKPACPGVGSRSSGW